MKIYFLKHNNPSAKASDNFMYSPIRRETTVQSPGKTSPIKRKISGKKSKKKQKCHEIFAKNLSFEIDFKL